MRWKTAVSTAAVLVLAALNVVQYLGRPSADQEAAGADREAAPGGRELADAIIEHWSEGGALFYSRWFGVKTLQNPTDAWITQEIIFQVKPDFIIETGTFKGGSAAYWAMILEHVNPSGRVITIDIEDQRTAKARNMPIVRRSVDFVLGSSTDPEIVADVARRVKGKKVLVILDSLHTRDHVLDELRAYAPLVKEGSYVIVQDTIVNGHPIRADFGPGPWEAVDDFLAEESGFEVDETRERFLLTSNRRGYLKRIPGARPGLR